MTRALSSLKYLPSVLCGLMVVAWPLSEFRWLGFDFRCRAGYFDVGLLGGNLMIAYSADASSTAEGVYWRAIPPGSPTRWAGQIGQNDFKNLKLTYVGIPFLLSLLTPLAVGSFIRYRFPLWSWFLWTAVVGVELAYYLT